MTPPATLPMCAQAIARRLQFRILEEELRHVADAIGWDEHDGATIPTAARQFRDLYVAARQAEPSRLSAETATKLFGECKVGQEKIGDETSSDLLARTATQTLAVATSALSGESSGLPQPVREPLRTARGLALMIYLFVRHALSRQRAGSLNATAALAAGAALVGVGLFVDIPGILMVIGLGLLLGAVALAALRRKLWRLIGVLLLGLLIGIAPRVADWITDDSTGVDEFVARIEPVVVVAGLLVAAYLLGRMSVEWPERATGQAQVDVAGIMSEHVYKSVEITGSSPEGVTQAIDRAVAKASRVAAPPRLVRADVRARPDRRRQGRPLPGDAEDRVPARGLSRRLHESEHA